MDYCLEETLVAFWSQILESHHKHLWQVVTQPLYMSSDKEKRGRWDQKVSQTWVQPSSHSCW